MSFVGCCIQSTRKDASTEKPTCCSTCIFIFFITTLLSQFNGFRTTQTHSNNWHMLVFILLAFTKTTWAVLRFFRRTSRTIIFLPWIVPCWPWQAGNCRSFSIDISKCFARCMWFCFLMSSDKVGVRNMFRIFDVFLVEPHPIACPNMGNRKTPGTYFSVSSVGERSFSILPIT